MSKTIDAIQPQKPHPLRRQYLVNKRYQGRFIAFLCVLTLFIGVIAAITVHTATKNALVNAMYRIHLPSGELWQLISRPLITVNSIIAGASFILATCVVLIIIRRSIRALRIIETEILTIDTLKETETQHIAEPLWPGISRKTSYDLQQLFLPFNKVADKLEEASIKTKKTEKSRQDLTTNLINEIDTAIAQIDQNIMKFQY